MRHKFYKNVITAIAFCFLGTIVAQKVEKKFTENFKVNKDVEVAINATNTEINVITWNKNEVQIDAFIEIEGMAKEDAEKYIKNWNFEALGNKKKVQITSKGNNAFGLKNDVVFFNNMDFNFEIPEIQIPNFDSIVIPDMNFDFDFDFDFDFETLEELEENMEKKGEYSFEFHNGDDHIVIKTKEEWEKFKKSKKYDELKETFKNTGSKLKIALQNSKKEMKALNKEQLKASINQAKLQIKNIDVKELQKSLQKAQETLKNMSFNFSGKSNDLTIDGKKIKIKKRLEIKVPKSATFDLNTRHCKVKLPNTVAFGNVNYGTFDANNLNGGKLTINYSQVTINDLNACTLFLNNVTDAKIASVTNSTMNNNSSGVNIVQINENTVISDKFGKLNIENIITNYNEFILDLDYSEATINLSNIINKLTFSATTMELPVKDIDGQRKTVFSGFINASDKNSTIKIEGKNSEITTIKRNL